MYSPVSRDVALSQDFKTTLGSFKSNKGLSSSGSNEQIYKMQGVKQRVSYLHHRLNTSKRETSKNSESSKTREGSTVQSTRRAKSKHTRGHEIRIFDSKNEK
mmetsp:Transcript_657/g.778  ORF Transcript_657/g.778 Transcript_657/m.778 type:complete len:102 (+) Transcript_657:626-931(+)